MNETWTADEGGAWARRSPDQPAARRVSLDDSAVVAGVHPTTLRAWLRRAWSPRSEDARCVAFTRRWLEADVLARVDERRQREFEAGIDGWEPPELDESRPPTLRPGAYGRE